VPGFRRLAGDQSSCARFRSWERASTFVFVFVFISIFVFIFTRVQRITQCPQICQRQPIGVFTFPCKGKGWGGRGWYKQGER